MNHELSRHELRAVRAYERLLAIRTEGWNELEAADAKFDGGEWSGAAWGDQWQEMDERCLAEVAERFELPGAEYLMHCSWKYEGEQEQREYVAHCCRNGSPCSHRRKSDDNTCEHYPY